jgi:hypothetical protein
MNPNLCGPWFDHNAVFAGLPTPRRVGSSGYPFRARGAGPKLDLFAFREGEHHFRGVSGFFW